MKICGLQKVTLLDFPGHVACTVFLGGCNFDCPFCYNSSLIRNDGLELLSKEELFDFLRRRKGILDGVAITGGEPLLHKEIVDFIKEIRELGFKIKLDTNGSFPSVLKHLMDSNLVDYVAMDIKNALDKYETTIDCKLNLSKIEESISLLINGNVDYEFRTTVVKEFHDIADFEKIGKLIKGAKRYYLQSYQYKDSVRCKDLSPMTKESLQLCLNKVKDYVEYASLREID
ncbi:MAG: anaerobic ribonucleoside-triphosphate reductase activating protein [Bacilli bacterium]|nr:anaerobic ribonucleoside-triphosphate reductase activating protein [Bacilli bacterium]